MEKKINIAEILKDKPKGTELYSPIFGKVTFIDADTIDGLINVGTKGGDVVDFFSDGSFSNGGECLLFPSDSLRDWAKFTWKKGDVVATNNGKCTAIFEKFNDDYSTFVGRQCLDCTDGYNFKFSDSEDCLTSAYSLCTNDSAQHYISSIEERLGGKLNMETLEIEKIKFEVGDIIFIKYEGVEFIFILSAIHNDLYNSKVCFELGVNNLAIDIRDSHFQKEGIENIRYATEEEKQQLFSALEKYGKKWNPNTKQIENIETKWAPKPFEKCVWRLQDSYGYVWGASFVSYIDDGFVMPMGAPYFEELDNMIVLPYNEETAKLIGTSNKWEGRLWNVN